MSVSSEHGEYSADEKLRVLQRLDQFRGWNSLDDERFCLCCQRLITGRQIQVTGGARGAGPLRLNCPSDGCRSIPMDWVLPTPELLTKIREHETLPIRSGLDQHRRGTPGNSPGSP